MFLGLQVCELQHTCWCKKTDEKGKNRKETNSAACNNSKVKMLPQLIKGVDQYIHDVARSVIHHQHKHAHVSTLASL